MLLSRYKNIIALVLLIASGISAYILWTNTFWGYWPLLFFISVWFLYILVAKKWYWNDSLKLRWLGLSTLSAVLLSVGFPPLPLTPVLFIAFIPLLIVQSEIESSGYKNKIRLHGRYAFHAFFTWNILTTFWVANSALIPSLAAFSLNSLFMIVPWMGMIRFGRRFPQWQMIAFIAFWFSWEKLHLSWEISWPWLTLGNAWAGLPIFVQWYEWTGVFGGGLWILSVNCLLFIVLKNKNILYLQWKDLKIENAIESKKIKLILAIVIIPILISIVRFLTYSEKGIDQEIAIIQPNYEPHHQKFNIPEEEQFIQFKKLSLQAISNKTNYLLWPESSIGNDIPFRTGELETDQRIKLYRDSIIQGKEISFIPGVTSMKVYRQDEKPGPAARFSSRQNVYYEINNAAILITRDSKTIPHYVKSKLVPGAEIFPYKNFLPFLKPLVDILGGSVAGLARQDDRTALDDGKHKIAPVICYESIYGDYMRGYFKNGAEAIFILTNDGWWDDTPGYRQHAMYGALRAIECRKAIARSANTGISCTIDQRGIFHNVKKYNTEAGFNASIKFNQEKTLYLILGDYIAWAGIVVTLIFSILGFYHSIKS